MPEQDATIPDAPPGRRPPRWTTGQGIGFLAALPGLLLLVGAVITFAATTNLEGDDADTAAGIVAVLGLLGVLMALPGLIVFCMCRTRRPR